MDNSSINSELSQILGEFDSVHLQDMLSSEEKAYAVQFLSELGINRSSDLRSMWQQLIQLNMQCSEQIDCNSVITHDSMERASWRLINELGFREKLEIILSRADDKYTEAIYRLIKIVIMKIIPMTIDTLQHEIKLFASNSVKTAMYDTMILEGATGDEADNMQRELLRLPKIDDDMPTHLTLIPNAQNTGSMNQESDISTIVKEELSILAPWIERKGDLDQAISRMSNYFVNQGSTSDGSVFVKRGGKVRVAQSLCHIYRRLSNQPISVPYLQLCVSAFACFSIEDLDSHLPHKTRLYRYMTRKASAY